MSVTRRVLADPAAKGRIMRGIMERARLAREKCAGGAALDAEETLALRYLRALEKMQAPVERRGTGGSS